MREDRQQLPCADIFADKRVLVVGLGKTGMSCVRFLVRRGVDVAVTDSREAPAELENLQAQFPDVAVFVGGLNAPAIERADVLLVSPGLSVNIPEISGTRVTGKQVIGDVEVFARCTGKPVVAITGSNGKSTVTSLLGEMSRLAKRNVAVGGNIGVPVLDLVEEDETNDLYVLELSSFQLETTFSLNPVASVVLNVSEDHMDRYGSFEEYKMAKSRIFYGDGVIVENMDEPVISDMVRETHADRHRISFSNDITNKGCDFGLVSYQQQTWIARKQEPLLPVSGLKLKGNHNVSNVLAALALGSAVDLPMTAMLEAIRVFPGLPHRTQWVSEAGGVLWINDSKATNVGATIAAVKGFADYPLILIMGGQGKGQDFSVLRDVLAGNVKHVFLLGEDAKKIAAVISDVTNFSYADDMRQAVTEAHAIAQPGDAVLLSPACASFDMFSGYEHRGQVFSECVNEVDQ